MRIPVKFDYRQIKVSELMQYHKQVQVLTYCQRCSNYGVNHSCPDFDFDVRSYVSEFNYATVVMTGIDTMKISKHPEFFEKSRFESRVLDNYTKGKEDYSGNWMSELSMKAFNEIKDWMSGRLIEAEREIGEAMSLPPGSCTRCKECLKQKGHECVKPELLRYSLEALGFLVSDIYHEVFGKELGWAQGQLPETFNTCSVLLTKEALPVDRITRIIGHKDFVAREIMETDRLVLRPFMATDTSDLYEYLGDEKVVRFEPYSTFSYEECKTEAECRSHNDSFYAVVLKTSGKVIGNVYFNKVHPEHVESYELGYVFNRHYSGKGYATEAAAKVVDYAFRILGAHRIAAYCNTENVPSWRLLERLGMRREATRLKNMFFDRDEHGQPIWFDSYQYALLAEEYLAVSD